MLEAGLEAHPLVPPSKASSSSLKPTNPERTNQNNDVHDFELTETGMHRLGRLTSPHHRMGSDQLTMNTSPVPDVAYQKEQRRSPRTTGGWSPDSRRGAL